MTWFEKRQTIIQEDNHNIDNDNYLERNLKLNTLMQIDVGQEGQLLQTSLMYYRHFLRTDTSLYAQQHKLMTPLLSIKNMLKISLQIKNSTGAHHHR